jgi:hypothetical protein
MITTMKNLLEFQGEPKTSPRNYEDAQGEKKQKGKGNKEDKGKANKFKGSEDNGKQTSTTQEKQLISCWICAKENYVKNYLLK